MYKKSIKIVSWIIIFLVASVVGLIYGINKTVYTNSQNQSTKLLDRKNFDQTLKNNSNSNGLNPNISNMYHPENGTRTTWSLKNFYDPIRDYVYATGWWDGDESRLLTIYNYKTGDVIKHFDTLPNSAATRAYYIYSPSPDNDYIWVSTDTGVYVLNADTLTGHDYLYSDFPVAFDFPIKTTFEKSFLDTQTTIKGACGTTENNMQLIYAYPTSITGTSILTKSLQAYCIDSSAYTDPTKLIKKANYDYTFPGSGTYIYRAYFTKYYLAISDLRNKAEYYQIDTNLHNTSNLTSRTLSAPKLVIGGKSYGQVFDSKNHTAGYLSQYAGSGIYKLFKLNLDISHTHPNPTYEQVNGFPSEQSYEPIYNSDLNLYLFPGYPEFLILDPVTGSITSYDITTSAYLEAIVEGKNDEYWISDGFGQVAFKLLAISKMISVSPNSIPDTLKDKSAEEYESEIPLVFNFNAAYTRYLGESIKIGWKKPVDTSYTYVSKQITTMNDTLTINITKDSKTAGTDFTANILFAVSYLTNVDDHSADQTPTFNNTATQLLKSTAQDENVYTYSYKRAKAVDYTITPLTASSSGYCDASSTCTNPTYTTGVKFKAITTKVHSIKINGTVYQTPNDEFSINLTADGIYTIEDLLTNPIVFQIKSSLQPVQFSDSKSQITSQNAISYDLNGDKKPVNVITTSENEIHINVSKTIDNYYGDFKDITYTEVNPITLQDNVSTKKPFTSDKQTIKATDANIYHIVVPSIEHSTLGLALDYYVYLSGSFQTAIPSDLQADMTKYKVSLLDELPAGDAAIMKLQSYVNSLKAELEADYNQLKDDALNNVSNNLGYQIDTKDIAWPDISTFLNNSSWDGTSLANPEGKLNVNLESLNNLVKTKAQADLGMDINDAQTSQNLLGYNVETLLTNAGKTKPSSKSEIENFDNQGHSYKEWLNLEAKAQLHSDVKTAETNANLLGYNATEVRGNNPLPANLTELNNYQNSDMTYKNWLTQNASLKLDDEIKTAENNKVLTGYDINTLLDGHARPANKEQLNNFAGSGKSYEEWLVSRTNDVLNEMISKSEINAKLLGYSATEVRGNNPLPANLTELNNYQNTDMTYENWLSQNATLKLDADIKTAETNPLLKGYDINKLLNGHLRPSNKGQLNNFANSGQTYANWLVAQTNNVLNEMITNAEKNANLLGYTAVEVRGLTPLPTNLKELNNYQNSGYSYQQWLSNHASLLLDDQKNSAEKSANTLGYSIAQLTSGASAINNASDLNNFNGSNISYQQWLTNKAKEKLHDDIMTSEHNANTYGYSLNELLKSGHGLPKNYAELTNYKDNQSFETWLSGQAQKLHDDSQSNQTNVETKLILAIVLPVLALVVILSMFISYIWAHRTKAKREKDIEKENI